MNPETAIDLFIEAMEDRHWSTSTKDVNAAREQALRTIELAILWDLREWVPKVAPESQEIAEPPAQQEGEDG